IPTVLARETHEPWTGDGERYALQVALGQIRTSVQDALVGRAAGPVHLVVDPRGQTQTIRLLDAEPDPLEIALAEIRHLQSVPAMEHDAVHPLVPELLELVPHLRRIQLPVQEPKRQDPEIPIGRAKALGIRRPGAAHGITVAFTNPSGFS